MLYEVITDQLNCTYQWLNNNYDIADKINKSITIKENGGSFKVRVTNTLGGCSVTSANPVVITVNSNPEAVITSYSIHYTKLYEFK